MFAKTENKSRMRVIAASPRAEVKKNTTLGTSGQGSFIADESVPKIIINDTIIFFLKLKSALW